jgi:alpha-tubulin suppressor-like RCC1 family protein
MLVRRIAALALLTLGCGFEPRGLGVDECAQGTDDCAPTATCVDTVESYTCTCPAAQVGDGRTCGRALAQIAAGHDATCGLDGAGAAWCWGANDRGQLGDGTDRHRATPTQVAGGPWKAIAAGYLRVCALAADDTAWCWGYGGFGFGDGTTADAAVPRLATGALKWQALTVGLTHQCALATDGRAWCWGYNRHGQLGNGTTIDANAPVPVNGGPWSAISAGAYHTCAVGAVGLACWGLGADGQLGSGARGDSTIPQLVTVTPAATWLSVHAGGAHTCATRDDGLWCWGRGARGAIGDGEQDDRLAPVKVSSASWTSVAAGAGHTCGVTGGALWCWGDDAAGVVGDGGDPDGVVATPVQIGTRTDWDVVGTAVADHACALTTDGAAWCWGHHGYDQLGTRAPTEQPTFTRWSGLTASAVAVQQFSTCAVRDDRTAGCAGFGYTGARGDGTFATRATLSTLPGEWNLVVPGLYHACGLDRAEGLWCWGADTDGALGNGAAGASATPVQVPGQWVRLAVGQHTTCAASRDHDLWCWGSNAHGQVGDNSQTSREVPVQVLTASQPWRALSLGPIHTCAIDDAEDLYCWGHNGRGQLGIGVTGGVRTRFERVGTDSDWQAVSAGGFATCGIRGVGGVGRLYCWGDNARQQLGLGGAVTAVATPTQVGAVETWADVAAGAAHACAIRADGTLWCWGDSEWFGHGAIGPVETPQQIGAATDWKSVEASANTTCAIAEGGAVWCAGANHWSQLGTSSVVTAPALVAMP